MLSTEPQILKSRNDDTMEFFMLIGISNSFRKILSPVSLWPRFYEHIKDKIIFLLWTVLLIQKCSDSHNFWNYFFDTLINKLQCRITKHKVNAKILGWYLWFGMKSWLFTKKLKYTLNNASRKLFFFAPVQEMNTDFCTSSSIHLATDLCSLHLLLFEYILVVHEIIASSIILYEWFLNNQFNIIIQKNLVMILWIIVEQVFTGPNRLSHRKVHRNTLIINDIEFSSKMWYLSNEWC